MTSPSRLTPPGGILAACVLTATFTSVAAAEEKLEEITVTAEKREESLQKVPISIAALSSEAMEKLGTDSLNDYFKYVPGINYAPTASGDRGGQNLIIRGVSNTRLTGVDSAASAATTSFYLNEIPVTLIDPELFDVNRVEVLKGPQGTLFGAASMGGTVRIIMNEANPDEWESRVEATAQMRDEHLGDRVNAMINIPLVEGKLGARIVAYQRYDDGYIGAITPPRTDTTQQLYPTVPGFDLITPEGASNIRRDTNTSEAQGARISLTYTPTEQLKISPTFIYQNIDKDDADTFDANLKSGFVKKRFLPEPQSQSFALSSLEGSYDFGPAKLVSATGYFNRKYLETSDQTLGTFVQFGGTRVTDWCPAGNCIAGTGVLGASIDTDSFTQELRLQSTSNSGSELFNRFDWVVGAYYSREKRDGGQLWLIPGFTAAAARPIVTLNDVIFASNWDSKDTNKSAFLDVGFHITEKLKISAGARHYDQSQQTARNLIGPLQGAAFATTPQVTFVSTKSTGVTPRYTASYQFTPDVLTYVSAAKGFRAGGGIIPVTEPACVPVIEQQHLEAFTSGFGPDNLWNYEVGTKTTWAGGRVNVNGAAYRIKWGDLQQGISLGQFFNSACTRALTANVGNAEIRGAELEFKALLTDRLLVQSSGAYTRARISGVDPAARVGYVGAQLQNVPDWTATASAEYSFPNLIEEGSGYLRADYSYRSSITTVVGVPTNPLLALPSYSNANVRAGVERNRLNIELFVANLFDKVQLLSAAPGVAGATTQVANYPRTVGIKIGKSF